MEGSPIFQNYLIHCLIKSNIFVSHKTIKSYGDIIKSKDYNNIDHSSLWNYKYIFDANTHPETGEPINILFRWASFVPTNIPIMIGLALLPPTIPNQLFFQSLNQLYNFGLNSSNGSKDNVMEFSQTVKNFGIILCAAFTGSIGISLAIKSLKLAQNKEKLLLSICPLFGIQFAGCTNFLLSRAPDFAGGFYMLNSEKGDVVSDVKSKNVVNTAKFQGVISRLILPIPLFFLPKIGSKICELTIKNIYLKNNLNKSLIDIGLSSVALYYGASFAMSIFNPIVKVNVNDLEDHFKAIAKENNYEYLYFNKGL